MSTVTTSVEQISLTARATHWSVNLYRPAGSSVPVRAPGVVVTGSWSTVKEDTAGIAVGTHRGGRDEQ
jgi:hypothetical protein